MKRYLYTALTAAIVLAVLTFSGATVVDALVRMGHGLGPTEEGCGVPGWDLRMAAIFGSYSVLMSATLLTPLAFLSRDLFAMITARRIFAATVSTTLAIGVMEVIKLLVFHGRAVPAELSTTQLPAYFEYALYFVVPIFITSLVALSMAPANNAFERPRGQ